MWVKPFPSPEFLSNLGVKPGSPALQADSLPSEPPGKQWVLQIRSDQISRSVVSDSLQSHVLWHSRLPCPSLSPGVCSNSCPLSHWCSPIISSSVASFSSCPQSFPASGSCPMSQLFASSGQSIGTSLWISHRCTCVLPSWTPSHLPPHPIPLGCPSAPALSALLHASDLHWSSILHMVIHMFQCYSLKSSHPHLLPPSPKVCSLHLCLFCCLVYRVFLNFIYDNTHVSMLFS